MQAFLTKYALIHTNEGMRYSKKNDLYLISIFLPLTM